MKRTILTAAVLCLAAGFAPAQEEGDKPVPAEAKKAFVTTDGYPGDTCIVSGKKMKEVVTTVIGDRTFKTCCKKCAAKVKADPETFAKKLDAQIAAAQTKGYALTTCVISGKKLGSMGDPIELVLGTRLVKLCCKGCVKKAKADALVVAAKVEKAAFAKANDAYKAKTCPVSGEKLGSMGEPFAVLHGNSLIKLCCKGCLKKVNAAPEKYLAKLASAKPGKTDKTDKTGKTDKPGKTDAKK